MDTDDLEPKRPVPGAPDLAALSVESLMAYKEQLQAEILKVDAAIEKKKSARAAADSVFK